MPTRSTVDVLDHNDRNDGDLSPRAVVTERSNEVERDIKEEGLWQASHRPMLYAWPFRPIMTEGRQGIKQIYAPKVEGKCADIVSAKANVAEREVRSDKARLELYRITRAASMTIPIWP